MLPRLAPNARTLTWGYEADVLDVMGGTSSDRILQHAHTLIAHLHADRSASGRGRKSDIYKSEQIENALNRPIIFLCHSLGDIVVKRVRSMALSTCSVC